MPAAAPSKTAVAYLRVSSKGQLRGHGLARQRRAVELWAKSHGYELSAVYLEQGVSGSLAQRPELARMLLELEQLHPQASLVLVEKLDRLARDLIVQETIIAQVQRLGRSLASASEGPDLLDSDPSRKLVRQLFGAIAEYDKAITVAKLAAARARKRSLCGRCEGRKPFGSRPGEAETLQRIKLLRRRHRGERLSYERIARTLNAEARPTRTGRPWHEATVRKIVRRLWPALAR
jgi:DNA invertase Pin-like site-specific DNA recombinase